LESKYTYLNVDTTNPDIETARIEIDLYALSGDVKIFVGDALNPYPKEDFNIKKAIIDNNQNLLELGKAKIVLDATEDKPL